MRAPRSTSTARLRITRRIWFQGYNLAWQHNSKSQGIFCTSRIHVESSPNTKNSADSLVCALLLLQPYQGANTPAMTQNQHDSTHTRYMHVQERLADLTPASPLRIFKPFCVCACGLQCTLACSFRGAQLQAISADTACSTSHPL
jgi:hypothetical protein